ncbi:YaeQ family protein [Hahella sp. KA22]|uniref:YaeQ family protein n=1 Tax=Hahella sp. KA22 TaxID=1628392 RepID=UPI000FDE7DF1|nr:YaeQ family protein [Hahella sp. KA22]AZZ90351.1 YaeQ family protein [Hahella sp. KA22]QAY53722.1 YaeQ family protein [Hahella sp. KA22]
MALKATIYKAVLHVADMDRNYYEDLTLTIARHPSETDERMMLRLVAFALHASDRLQFTKGISTQDEPDIWEKSLSDEIDLWIDLGLPEESRIRKACGRARQVIIYAYGGRAVPLWWRKYQDELARFDNLRIMEVSAETTKQLAELAQRAMDLQCTIQDGQVWLSDASNSVAIEPVSLFPA